MEASFIALKWCLKLFFQAVLLHQGCQTESQEGQVFLWFPFNQLSIKACRPRCVHSLANQWLDWTKGAENNPKTSRHSGPPGLEFYTCVLHYVGQTGAIVTQDIFSPNNIGLEVNVVSVV